ncbi:MAG: hypothetical protein KA521_02235 [Crocinitomicaceae bacterium]|nr:hypothetical protein [Crocinitomicaceae bacterium]
MQKNKIYITLFLIIIAITLVSYYGLVSAEFILLPFKGLQFVLISEAALFVSGTFIIAPGLIKSEENFVARFLILTTVQMLAILSIILALVYLKYPTAKAIGFQLLFVFLFLMSIQSFLLVKIKNRKLKEEDLMD